MKLKQLAGFTAALLLALSPAVGAQDEELTVLSPRTGVSFSIIRRLPGIIGLTFIDVRRHFLAVARRIVRSRGLEPPWGIERAPEGPVSDMIEFYRREGDRLVKIAQSDPGYLFEGMRAESGLETDRLFTHWVTGSAKALIIFALQGNEVGKVFSWAGKVAPEFIGLANDGQTYLVVTDGRIFTREGRTTYPKEASIYSWDGHRYVLKREVPWERRLEALKDLWPREYPKE